MVEGMLAAELLEMGEVLTAAGFTTIAAGIATSETGVGAVVGVGAGLATTGIGISIFGAGVYGVMDFLGITECLDLPQIVPTLCKECK